MAPAYYDRGLQVPPHLSTSAFETPRKKTAVSNTKPTDDLLETSPLVKHASPMSELRAEQQYFYTPQQHKPSYRPEAQHPGERPQHVQSANRTANFASPDVHIRKQAAMRYQQTPGQLSYESRTPGGLTIHSNKKNIFLNHHVSDGYKLKFTEVHPPAYPHEEEPHDPQGYTFYLEPHGPIPEG